MTGIRDNEINRKNRKKNGERMKERINIGRNN